MGEYASIGAPIAFGSLVEAVRKRDQVAIGYRIAAQSRDPDANRGIVLNPAKSSVATFAADDQVILLGSF